MQDQVAELVRQGRALPPSERERVVDGLLESLNSPATESLDPSWEKEIGNRLAEYDRGDVQAIDSETVFAKARHIASE